MTVSWFNFMYHETALLLDNQQIIRQDINYILKSELNCLNCKRLN